VHQLNQMAFVILTFSLLASGCSYSKRDRAVIRNHFKLVQLSEGEHRSETNKVRNVYRNPVETLKFFDVRPEMTVVEISPGKGWYTEILGPYLSEGALIVALPRNDSDKSYHQANNKALRQMFKSHPSLFKTTTESLFEPPVVMGPIAPDNSVDRVLTFRNLHNWVGSGKGKESMQAMFKALKPGGIMGIVDHRADPNKKQDLKSGYIREDYVIELAESVGFQFVSKAEINANYLDSRNHANGVWTLPPSLRGDSKQRFQALAIGESDRMTLKFVKPASSSLKK
jgi:predicted methyltransferase